LNYFPNIDKLKNIAEILQYDTSNAKSKIEYVIHTYLLEDYKVFDNSRDYWLTTSMISNSLFNKDFLKSIKKQSPNYVYSQIDQVIVSVLLQRSSEQPKKRIAIDSMNPDLMDDEPFRITSE
jgi:hypothetical protein